MARIISYFALNIHLSLAYVENNAIFCNSRNRSVRRIVIIGRFLALYFLHLAYTFTMGKTMHGSARRCALYCIALCVVLLRRIRRERGFTVTELNCV